MTTRTFLMILRIMLEVFIAIVTGLLGSIFFRAIVG